MIKELSVVIPIFNAAEWIDRTIERTEEAIRQASIQTYEIIVIDDGSSDDTAKIVENLRKKNKHIKLHVQENKGRFIARKQGVDRARYNRILFVDARTWIDKGSLKFLSNQIDKHPKRLVWNSHINVEKKGNIIARFGDVITLLGWRRYFKKPKLTSYGLEDFDYYPKGTGLFCVPTEIIKEAIHWFESNTKDIRNSSDDTLLIRHIAESNKIWLSPDYSGSYFARTTLPAFVKHTYDRGRFFVDGFMRPGTRFFYPLIAVLAISAAALVSGWLLLFMQPSIVGMGVGILLLLWLLMLAVVKILGISTKDTFVFGVLSPVFCVVYLGGIWSAVLRMGMLGDSHRFGRFINQYRSWARGTIREYIGVTVLFIALVVPLTNFTLFHITHQIFSGPGDATAGFLWMNAINHTIDPIVGFTNVVNYPFGQDIGGWTLVSYLAYWLPMRVLSFFFGPVAAMNIMMAYAYTSAAVAMYWLIKRVTNKKALAFFAGYAAAFGPYAMLKSVGHFSYIFSAIFPILIGIFISLWTSPTRKKAIIFGLLAAVPFYTDGYFMLMAAVLYVSMIATGIVSLAVKRSRNMLRQYTICMAVAFAALLVALSPLFAIQKLNGSSINAQLQNNRSDIVGEIHAYRSNVADFFLPPFNSASLENDTNLAKLHAYNNQRSNGSENNDFISPVFYIFGALGVVSAAVWVFKKKWSSLNDLSSEERVGLFMLIGVCAIGAVLAFATMFSPDASVHGIRIPLPGELLIKYNISLWRVLSRLFVLFNILIVILGIVGIWLFVGKNKHGKSVYFPTLLLCAVVTVYFYAQNFPTRPFDFNTGLPGTYYWLKDQKDIKSIAELPIVDPLDGHAGDYATAQIIHGKKLMNLKDPTNVRVNNALGTLKNPEVANLLRDRGIDAVIDRTHQACAPDNTVGKLIHAETNVKYYDLQLNKPTRINMCVYKVSKAKTDPAFVRFDKGFNPSANAPDQSKIAMQEGADGWMTVTDDSFTKSYNKEVRLSGVIHNTSGAGTGWALKDSNGKVLASGSFSKVRHELDADFSVTIDHASRVNLVVTGKDVKGIKLAQVYLANVEATASSN